MCRHGQPHHNDCDPRRELVAIHGRRQHGHPADYTLAGSYMIVLPSGTLHDTECARALEKLVQKYACYLGDSGQYTQPHLRQIVLPLVAKQLMGFCKFTRGRTQSYGDSTPGVC